MARRHTPRAPPAGRMRVGFGSSPTWVAGCQRAWAHAGRAGQRDRVLPMTDPMRQPAAVLRERGFSTPAARAGPGRPRPLPRSGRVAGTPMRGRHEWSPAAPIPLDLSRWSCARASTRPRASGPVRDWGGPCARSVRGPSPRRGRRCSPTGAVFGDCYCGADVAIGADQGRGFSRSRTC